MQIYFPYSSIRKEQDRLLQDCIAAIKNKKIMFAHAPTGLGKTAAVLSPAVSFGLMENKKVFFLTPKISQHEIAVDLLNSINKKFGTNILGIDLVGKCHMCSNPYLKNADDSAFYDLCKRMRKKETCSFYANTCGYTAVQKVKAKANLSIVKGKYKGTWHHIYLKEFCENFEGASGFGLCSYEVAMHLASEANVIIADYFHLFSPKIRAVLLQRIGVKLSDCIIIVDEAHNLPERLRKLISSTLSTKIINSAIEETKKIGIKCDELLDLKNAFKTVTKKILKETETKIKPQEVLISREEFESACKGIDLNELSVLLYDLAVDYLEAFPYGKCSLQKISSFLERWVSQEESFLRILRVEDENIYIKLKAMDPSVISKQIFEDSYAAVLMSGTLLPQQMYADLLGVPKDRFLSCEYKSPFPEENKLTLFVPTSTTKYCERNPKEYEKIAETVANCVNAIPGNTAVFFPCFNLLNSVIDYAAKKIKKKIFVQTEGMSTRERFLLLTEFKKSADKGAVLFAVASGSFAEGIDYIGNQLLGAIIVGIPLNEMDLEQKCLIEYYQRKFGAGWYYAYINPAITRAIQASGRVIRDRKDRGVVVFLDKRYLWKNYSKCFPKDMKKIITTEPEEYISRFWKPLAIKDSTDIKSTNS
ncbi:MAG: ATP-dependent DNA helicase [Candidatus Diapherotrites archaeon]